MKSLWRSALRLVEGGWVPDALVRAAVRRLASSRLDEREACDANALAARLSAGPIALRPDLANEQHYEVPAEFFLTVLGPRLKYSACLWESGTTSVAAAEEAMLRLTCERAEIRDGMRVLDLGCGWGSLSFWIAENHPESRIVAVSNSTAQRRHIENECKARGIDRIEVVTADINDFHPEGRFDRVVSVEMFEHVRNHARLLARIADWLVADGKLFVHIFTHRDYAYTYEVEGEGDWMARWFFTGGMMPSRDWLVRFADHLVVERAWHLPGTHYEATLNAWLATLDERRDRVLPILERIHGTDNAALWLQRWRLFLLGSAETFGYASGQEWGISHYRFHRKHDGNGEAP